MGQWPKSIKNLSLSLSYPQNNEVLTGRGGSRISEEGVQMKKRGVRLPIFTQNLLKFPMKMK